MAWIETIEVRSIKISCCENLDSTVDKVLRNVMNENKELSIEVYKNFSIETDFCIHLKHCSERIEAHGSKIGIQLKAFFDTLGFTNHNVWVKK